MRAAATADSTYGWAFDGPEPDPTSDDWTNYNPGRFPEPTTLYHWAPTDRRDAILSAGLAAGNRNITGPTYHDPAHPELGEFLQPVVCMSPDPAAAWNLSHGMWARDGYEVDLWAIAPDPEDVLTTCRFDFDDGTVSEVRTAGPIVPSRLTLLGTRTAN